jgi:hypothetical protein
LRRPSQASLDISALFQASPDLYASLDTSGVVPGESGPLGVVPGEFGHLCVMKMRLDAPASSQARSEAIVCTGPLVLSLSLCVGMK